MRKVVFFQNIKDEKRGILQRSKLFAIDIRDKYVMVVSGQT